MKRSRSLSIYILLAFLTRNFLFFKSYLFYQTFSKFVDFKASELYQRYSIIYIFNNLPSKVSIIFLRQKIALRSESTGKYVSINDDTDECILYAHSEIITHRETFEVIKIKDTFNESSPIRLIIALKSIANAKIVSIESEWILKANKLGLGVNEAFIVYFGPDNKIIRSDRKETSTLSPSSSTSTTTRPCCPFMTTITIISCLMWSI